MTQPNCICRTCGTAFYIKPSAILHGEGKFCSRTCKHARLPNRICEHCGKSFYVQAALIAVGRGKYCCHPCSMEAKRTTLAERFWLKVDKNGPLIRPELGQCWAWDGGTQEGGYGEIGDWPNGIKRAHRLSWELHNGPIPDGLWVLHRCDNPPCTRPDHLFLGTHQENMDDMISKGRKGIPVLPTGEAHWQTKLTTEQVLEIYRSYAAREATQPELVNRFGVSKATISKIVLGQTWTHLNLTSIIRPR